MDNIFYTIKESCIRHKDNPAFSIRQDNGCYRTYTFEQVLENADKYSLRLSSAGLTEGDRVALIAENSPEWVIAFLSIISLKCTAVLIDSTLSSNEINDFINKSDLRGIMMSPKVREQLKHLEDICLPTFNIINNASTFAGDTAVLEEDYPPTSDPDTEVLAILYSSGTTSTSKGVMQTHDSVRIMAMKNIENNLLNHNDRMLAVVPLYHIFGFMAKMICPLLCGTSICFLESANAENMGMAFLEFKPTGFACVPRVFDMFGNKIMDAIRSKGKPFVLAFNILFKLCYFVRKTIGINLGKIIFRSVHKTFGGCIRGFLSGGAMLDPNTSKLFFGLGFFLLNNYGITETNIPITTNNFSYYSLSSSGWLLKDIYLRINNPDENQSGEVYVKSPGMMKGYFRDTETTKSAFSEDGWFCTGDIGYLDKHKNLTITGRIKENIILATGKKISPNDLESFFKKIDGVSEFIICGIPKNASSFDEIHAFVVKDKTQIIKDSKIEAEVFRISSSLPSHMRIAKVNIISEIPKTALQKPKRYLLKDMVLVAGAANAEAACTQELSISDELHLNYYKTVFEIASKFNYSKIAINKNSKLFEDIGFDSLTATEFCLQLESKTGKNISQVLKPNITIIEIADLLGTDEKLLHISGNNISKYPMKKRPLESFLFKLTKLLLTSLYKIEVNGISNIPDKGSFLICPNHETHLDAFFILSQLPTDLFHKFCCMAKMEHLRNPFGRIMLRIGGGIPVDRYNNPAPAFERCLHKLLDGWIVLIHPEGTRTNDGSMGEFKKGASKLSINSGLPIVPVRICGGYNIYPKGRLLPKLFNIKKLRRHKLSISFGKPLFPGEFDTESLTFALKNKIIEL